MARLELAVTADGARVAVPPMGSRLSAVRVYRSAGREVSGRTEGEEAAIIVLGGTFDLRAGGNAWGSRGSRSDPFAGRPVAVFLPPRCEWSGVGTGELLVLGAVVPPAAEKPVTGREALARKPLLQMAGSGKAFDPVSGEWKTHEEFASSPQAVLPRHIERVEVAAGGRGGAVVAVERVFPVSYKALGLCVDEAVVPAGVEFRVTELVGRPAGAVELMVYVRARGVAEVRCGGAVERAESVAGADGLQRAEGEAAFALRLGGDRGAGDMTVTARGGPCYVALAWAGK